NRRAGVLIGKGVPVREAMKQVGAVVEGYYAAKAARELAAENGINMPICEEIYNVLYEGKSPLEALKDLMARDKKREDDSGEESWVG
ncbi:MAG: glycerol-3-phosphate dehydrogenase, partial [Clostridiales bacterium]|nr:glycerol-3-phosphate dehydrogenase [Clostridiales bacterium]